MSQLVRVMQVSYETALGAVFIGAGPAPHLRLLQSFLQTV